MTEEDAVTVNIIQCMFTEEYGWMDAHRNYDVRADLAERWIGEGKALPAEKKLVSGAVIETPEDNLAHETATIKRRKNVR